MIFITPLIFKYFTPYICTTISDTGIVLDSQTGQSESYQWARLNAPPMIEYKRFVHYLVIRHGQTTTKIPLKIEKPDELKCFLQKAWAVAHRGELCDRIRKLETLLKVRYLSHGLYDMVKSAVAPFSEQWLPWAAQLTFDHNLTDAIMTLTELDSWSKQDLSEFKEAYVNYKLSEHEAFFDTVESQPLTAAQRRACVIQDERQLLLAGAGTGKTSVMVAKAQYLFYTRQAYAKQVLLLAYGKQAAQEMLNRASHYPTFPDCMTFHKLGLHIIESVEGMMPKVSELAQNEISKRAFVRETILLLCQEEQYRLHLIRYVKQVQRADVVDIHDYLDSSKGKRLISDFSTSLGLLKCRHATTSLAKLESQFNESLACVRPILAEYTLYLSNEGAIDFEDMIIQSIDYVQSKKFMSPWTHLLVDEFQDISPIRAKLLKSLIEQSERHYLFAVGDDWQSIYRFSGADIGLTTDFTHHFGDGTVTQLDKTFRYPQGLLDVTSRFVCANPAQIMKRITAHNVQHCTPLVYVEEPTEEQSLSLTLESLNTQAECSVSVLLLARYHKVLPSKQQIDEMNHRYQHLHLRVMTFHAAKGMEADYAVILGLAGGANGFPAQDTAVAFLDALLPDKEPFPYAEERRLFYVALTRAKQQIYLIIPPGSRSEFVQELDS